MSEQQFGNVDTSLISGDINYVYIKLGASGYGKGDLKILDYNNYIEQVKVCEELGVPYGFYYYSTSTTVEEANMELECIKERIEDLKEITNMENNKLEIVIDIELSSAKDRQYRGNIEQQTEAKAALINGIQSQGLSDNVLIYGPARVMRYDGDQIINLRYLHSMLSNPENVGFWLCSPTNTKGNPSKNLEKDITSIEEQGIPVVAQQVVLDGKVIGTIDINTMDLEHFQKLINSQESERLNTSSNSSIDIER